MKPYMLALFLAIVLLVKSSSLESPPSTSSYLTLVDKAQFKERLKPGLKFEDVSLAYYAVTGYKLIEEPVTYTAENCKQLLKLIGNGDNITPEVAFHAASLWKNIGVCQSGFPTAAVTKVLTSLIEKDTTPISDLYYSVSALTALSHKLSEKTVTKVVEILEAILKKEDSLSNLGYTFHIAADLGAAGSFAFSRIEDAIVQADEVDGQYLQFEGGLSVTSLLVNGIYKLSDSLKKNPDLMSHQIVKLANYLLSRRSVQTPKGIVGLLSALTTLASNKYEKPICITLAEDGMIVSSQQPLVKVKVCDVLGRPLPSVPAVAVKSVSKKEDGSSVVLSKKTFQQSSQDKTLFTTNLMESKLDRGFYDVKITADSVVNTVTVKVLSKVHLEYLEIGTGDADQTTQPKLTRVSYPNKLDQIIEADSQQKLVIRFLLQDASNKSPVRVHQAFVRLVSVSESKNGNKRGHEIIFVAERDASQVYKFDMPVGTAAANFGYQSGDYNVELIVGDALFSNPFQWTIATVSLKFPEAGPSDVSTDGVSQKQYDVYGTKPEIKHMFREPEKRPPALVSNLFTGLCAAPILLLLILWAKLGVNISNFPLSLSAVAFHVGLGGIFVLFGIFWLQLNMFVTLRYLLGLGIVTFLAGNKLLSHIACRHKLSSR